MLNVIDWQIPRKGATKKITQGQSSFIRNIIAQQKKRIPVPQK